MEQRTTTVQDITTRLELVSRILEDDKTRFAQQVEPSHDLQPDDLLKTFYASRAQLRRWQRIEAEYESVNALAPTWAAQKQPFAVTGVANEHEEAVRKMGASLTSLEHMLQHSRKCSKVTPKEHHDLFWGSNAQREEKIRQVETCLQSLKDLQAKDHAAEPLHEMPAQDSSGERLLKRLKTLRKHADNFFVLLAGALKCKCRSQHVADLRLRTLRTSKEFQFDLVFRFGSVRTPDTAWVREDTTVTSEKNWDVDPVATKSRKMVSFQEPAVSVHMTTQPYASGIQVNSNNPDIQDLCKVFSDLNLAGSDFGTLSNDNFKYTITRVSSSSGCGEQVRSLHEVLTNRDPSKRLNLPQRYGLAVALAEAHLHLHKTQWLGSRWSHDDVVFVVKDEIVQVHRPFLRTAMRLAGKSKASSRRDEATQSLGILLLELCFGKTLQEYRGGSQVPSANADISKDVVDAVKWVQNIQEDDDPEFRETFQGIVDFCLYPQYTHTIDGTWRQEMFFKVLQPLGAILRSITSIRECNFDSIAQRLRGIFEKAMVPCQMERVAPFDFEVEFCPDPAIWQIVQQHQVLLRALYIRSIKIRRAPDGSLLDDDSDSVTDEAEDFLCGLNRSKHMQRLLGALLFSRSTPTSYAWFSVWDKFTLACREIEPHSILEEQRLPLNDQEVKDLFGPSNRPEIAAFRTVQYCFCAARLQPLKQQNELDSPHMNKIRLPLKRKEVLSTKNANSRVFRVIVHSHHLYDEDKKLAMKEIVIDNIRIRDEWLQTSWLMTQIRSHRCIMTAHASLRVQKRVLLFYDLAICDLMHFMTVHRADGPTSTTDRNALFLLIAEIGDALHYLHCELKENYPNRMVCFHKDLKAENILVDWRRDGTDRMIFKITDFGISSTEHELDDPEDHAHWQTQPSLADRRVRTILGDGLSHSAPEARNGGYVSASADIWAYGTVLAEYAAWLFGGSESFNEFWTARTSTYGNSMSYRLIDTDDDGMYAALAIGDDIVLREEIGDWFTAKITSQRDAVDRLLLENCWWLLQKKLLVCDQGKRARITEVCQCLTKIAKGTLNPRSTDHRKRKPSQELTYRGLKTRR